MISEIDKDVSSLLRRYLLINIIKKLTYKSIYYDLMNILSILEFEIYTCAYLIVQIYLSNYYN